MQRTIARIVMFVIAGAIVNVAVAWACLQRDVGGDAERFTVETPDEAMQHGITTLSNPASGVGYRIFGISRQSQIGRRADHVSGFTWIADSTWDEIGVETRSGFPVYSCYSWLTKKNWNPTGNFPPSTIRPLWPGFLINTFFYATILWLLLFIPESMRRALRRRRSLCPQCAYPIGDFTICTECGATLHHTTATSLP
ncbi:MAG: hypothetical protein L0Y44_01275 [Phycisphaerales bacterium]|nr:hypothetical protein [Phycisphaerales bacterium]MCI0675350.1 hypothetical protein [Phycisphaerales bacterium]